MRPPRAVGYDHGESLAAILGDDLLKIGNCRLHVLELLVQIPLQLIEIGFRRFDLAGVSNADKKYRVRVDRGRVGERDNGFQPIFAVG